MLDPLPPRCEVHAGGSHQGEEADCGDCINNKFIDCFGFVALVCPKPGEDRSTFPGPRLTCPRIFLPEEGRVTVVAEGKQSEMGQRTVLVSQVLDHGIRRRNIWQPYRFFLSCSFSHSLTFFFCLLTYLLTYSLSLSRRS